MEKDQIFSLIADFYEYSITTGCNYELWAQYVLGKLKSHSTVVNCLDLGCGSGYLTRLLKQEGFNVTGVDVSAEMLTVARKKSADAHLAIDYMLYDISKALPFKGMDAVTAINDTINYIKPSKLKKTFANVAKCLKKGGMFMFDISSPSRLKNVIGNNTFCEDDEEFSYIWFNKLYDECVQMDMSVFLRTNDGTYIKREGSTIEYIHTLESIKKSLEESGFEVVAVEGENGAPYLEQSQRINMMAVKL